MNRIKKENMSNINKLPDQRAIRLQQIANCVIDAYLNRHQRFKPDFGEATVGIVYLERPEGDNGPANLQVGHWYEKADYEPEDQK
jgi:hypothetical protein